MKSLDSNLGNIRIERKEEMMIGVKRRDKIEMMIKENLRSRTEEKIERMIE